MLLSLSHPFTPQGLNIELYFLPVRWILFHLYYIFVLYIISLAVLSGWDFSCEAWRWAGIIALSLSYLGHGGQAETDILSYIPSSEPVVQPLYVLPGDTEAFLSGL